MVYMKTKKKTYNSAPTIFCVVGGGGNKMLNNHKTFTIILN